MNAEDNRGGLRTFFVGSKLEKSYSEFDAEIETLSLVSKAELHDSFLRLFQACTEGQYQKSLCSPL